MGGELFTVGELMEGIMPRLETEYRIRAILQRVARLHGDFGTRKDIFRDLGVKSVLALNLLLTLEGEFGVAIADESFGEARTVEELVSLVERLR
jgi:acyl carrier protein